MNDRFRFRAWDKSFNKYCENVIVSTINEEITVYGRLVNGRTQLIPNSHVVLEQCAGLKDKNGLLIYEGDIVLFKSAFDKEESFAEIKFGKADGYECFYPKWHGEYIEETKYNPGWRKDIHYWIEHQIEVVGNIHENPELLEVQK